jgi:hypothetical protein
MNPRRDDDSFRHYPGIKTHRLSPQKDITYSIFLNQTAEKKLQEKERNFFTSICLMAFSSWRGLEMYPKIMSKKRKTRIF